MSVQFLAASRLNPMTNWADSKHSVNSVNPTTKLPVGDTEPRLCRTHEGVETRHGEPYKSCSVCETEKPETEFYKKDRTGRLDSTCKACRISKNREKTLGVTDGAYWDMYKKQDGKCGICERRLYSKRYKSFCVDHNHATGAVRGLLCHNCNRAIGMLKDCPETIKRASEWVKV